MKLPNLNIWKDALNYIKKEGVGYFLIKVFFFVIGQMAIILYPLCLVMNIKIIPIWYPAIGHIACELDCYVKEGVLGLRPQYKAVLLVPHKNVANRHLLGYWKKYVFVVDNPALTLLLAKLGKSKFTTYNTKRYVISFDKNAAFPAIQKQYYGRPPLLSLTDFDQKRGWAALRKLGVPQNAWFACVHCREGGNIGNMQAHSLRDVDINSYFLAMKEIVQRGGWVIRMGDAAMKPIPPMKNTIDYAHLDVKSEWMDVFLCASSKFFLGSSSGLAAVASVFGISNAIANIALPFSGVLFYGPEDIGIPKLIWSEKEKRYLSFKEVLSSPIANFRYSDLFATNAIQVVENSPEDIKEVVIEILDKIEGKLKYSEDDERLQARFKSLMNPSNYSYGAISRVGRCFLRKYEYLL